MLIFLTSLIFCLGIVFSTMGLALAAGSGAYRLEVADAGASGMGSAFVGQANTPAAVYYNPAGMTQISSNAMSMGAALIQPFTDYEDNAGNESQMRRQNFGVPATFFVTKMGTEKVALGLGALSSWGLGTEWHPDSFARYSSTEARMQNKDFILALAYQMSSQVSLSVGLNVSSSEIEKQKKLWQGSGSDANFRLHGEDEAYGYTLAATYKLNERHQFGVTYRSEMELKYEGKATLEGLDSSAPLFLGSPAVFNGTTYETDVVAKNTLPDSIVLGYSFTPNEKWIFNFDLEWMNWSTTNKEEVAYPTAVGMPAAVLNSSNETAKDWESKLSFAMGTQYSVTERFRLRGGYYYRQSPVPEANWDPSMPDGDSHGFTLGTGLDLSKSLTLDLAWSGIWYEDMKIDNTVADAFGGIDGTYTQWTNLLYATLSYSF